MPENILSIRPQASFGAAQDRAYEHMQQIGIRYLELRVAHPSLARAEQAKYEPLGIAAASVHGQINLRLAERSPITHSFGLCVTLVVRPPTSSISSDYVAVTKLG